MADVSIAGSHLQSVLVALRACGDTRIPMKVAIRISAAQKTIVERLEVAQTQNNALIEEYGAPNEQGTYSVSPEDENWTQYLLANKELNEEELALGEPIVLYQKGEDYGWTPDVATPILVTANVITDLGDLLEIVYEEDEVAEETPEPEVIGHIEPTE